MTVGFSRVKGVRVAPHPDLHPSMLRMLRPASPVKPSDDDTVFHVTDITCSKLNWTAGLHFLDRFHGVRGWAGVGGQAWSCRIRSPTVSSGNVNRLPGSRLF